MERIVPMKILVLNAGSGSQKCSLFEITDPVPADAPAPLWQAEIDAPAPGQSPGQLSVKVQAQGREELRYLILDGSWYERVAALLRKLWKGEGRVLGGPEEIDVVGHRIVHGGADFDQAVRIDGSVEAAIERHAAFAPLHNASNLEGIRAARALLGDRTPQIAVFDTAFHRTLPEAAATYPGPYEWLGQGIRRYGFHGTSFRYASARAARLLGREHDPELRLVVCHLGGGCSLAAVRGGRSVDTTMGFTPLDGIAMCTRSGSVDPGILIYLLRQGITTDGLEETLNKESGLKGLSGLAGDTRIIVPAMHQGNARAGLAFDVFVHRLRAGIGAMIASLGGMDALVFTDGISEDEPEVRAAACEAFGFLGLALDPAKNALSPADADIAATGSRVRVLIVKTQENWQIATECRELVASEKPASAAVGM